MDELGRIGRGAGGGITRLAFTPEDWEARARFLGWMEHAGLAVRSDGAGNLFGRLSGQDDLAAPVLVGSHLDTVPNGGAFDGALGCVAALEAVQSIAEGSRPQVPIEVVVWMDEEGARFGSGLFGSRAFAGMDIRTDLTLADTDGITLAEAMRRRGLDPKAIVAGPPPAVAAYLEVHIEQGPMLERIDIPIGIVTGIVGMVQLRVEVSGKAGHAGTVPMEGRSDAMTAAAEMVLAIEARARAAGSGAVATVGQLEVRPGAGNVIPGASEFSVDLRAADSSVLERLNDTVRSAMREIAARRGVEATLHENLRLPPVGSSPRIQQLLAGACEREGYPVQYLPSGAGHDAMMLAGITEAGMLFVRCRNGISHSPDESITIEDAVAGTQVLLDALRATAGGSSERCGIPR